jgi:hypothetical protein
MKIGEYWILKFKREESDSISFPKAGKITNISENESYIQLMFLNNFKEKQTLNFDINTFLNLYRQIKPGERELYTLFK